MQDSEFSKPTSTFHVNTGEPLILRQPRDSEVKNKLTKVNGHFAEKKWEVQNPCIRRAAPPKKGVL